MIISKTKFEGLFVVDPLVLYDTRGYFYESYSKKELEKNGLMFNWVQDNQSSSKYGVIRGLHFQTGEFEQAKLIRCISGKILDIAVDIREGSKTYGEYFSIEISSENKKMVLIPRGFAHGFSTLSETAEILYKCDNFYNKDFENGIIYTDTKLNIDWKIPKEKIIISDKDLKYKYEWK